MIRLISTETHTVRADSARNRDAVLWAATRAFSTSDAEPSMRAIARDAGVGIATLYRHFPTKESLVDAVYGDQVQRLTIGAGELIAKLPPADALREWMDLFGSWLATKHGMTETLLAMIDAGDIVVAHTRTQLLDAINSILEAGRSTGHLRSDISAEDVATSLLGIFGVAGKPHQGAQAGRLLDLLMDGLKVPRHGK
ncbi:MAG: TetR/AcrR family transcriptional regulator [Lacisediminihabitans sp.]